jgi:hypothetical protein
MLLINLRLKSHHRSQPHRGRPNVATANFEALLRFARLTKYRRAANVTADEKSRGHFCGPVSADFGVFVCPSGFFINRKNEDNRDASRPRAILVLRQIAPRHARAEQKT